MKNKILIGILLTILCQLAWGASPTLYFHPIRLANAVARQNDMPEDGVLPQNNRFIWVKLGLEFPMHGGKSFVFAPRYMSRNFNQSAKDYWTQVLDKQEKSCTSEGNSLKNCEKYTTVAEGNLSANNFDVFEMGWEMRFYAGARREGHFQKAVLITGVAYYEADNYGLRGGSLKVNQDNSFAVIFGGMYGIGYETRGKHLAFTIDSAIGVQLAGPFPRYAGSQQTPLESDIFRAEVDVALGFAL